MLSNIKYISNNVVSLIKKVMRYLTIILLGLSLNLSGQLLKTPYSGTSKTSHLFKQPAVAIGAGVIVVAAGTNITIALTNNNPETTGVKTSNVLMSAAIGTGLYLGYRWLKKPVMRLFKKNKYKHKHKY